MTPRHKYPFWEIEWDDAYTVGGWQGPDELDPPMRVVSRGWVVKETKVAISLAGSISENDINQIVTIPKNMIRKKRKLRVT